MRLEVRRAEARDLPEIKRLIDVYIAEDYYSIELLEASIRGENNLFYVVTDADRDDAIISFFYAFNSYSLYFQSYGFNYRFFFKIK